MATKRRVFYSFHYIPDCWRAAQVRSMGVVEGNTPCSDNDWETITKGGDKAIESWIQEQMRDKTCAVVLIGGQTAQRRWIEYEIVQAWNSRKGLLGVRIHKLLNQEGRASVVGHNPFDFVSFKSGAALSSKVRTYDPPGTSSRDVYAQIKANLATWIEDAIAIRTRED